MRILSYAYILDTIIHADFYLVVFTKQHELCDIEAMRHRERRVATCELTIHVDCGFDMWTLKVKLHPTLFPLARYAYGALIPCFAYIVATRSEEERKLHLACLAIFSHVGVEIERGVVEAACPLGVDGYFVAKVVGEHRTREVGFLAVCHGPRACEVEATLGRSGSGKEERKEQRGSAMG